jgi:hypothetical protein
VKLSEVEPFSGILPAPNALAIAGGVTTVMLAFDVLPMPPSVEVTCTLLFLIPAVLPLIFSDTVQDASAARVPPVKLADEEPVLPVAVPPHVLFRLLGVPTTIPAGKLSVNARPVNVTPVFGFWIVNVRAVTPSSGISLAPNVLVIDGGLATVKFALAVLPVPPFVEVTGLVVLVYCPGAVPVRVTIIVQESFTAMLPPARPMLVLPGMAVDVPLQLFESPFGVATVSPAGSASVNPTPVMATVLAAGFVIVNVS